MRKLDWVELGVWAYAGTLSFLSGYFLGWKTPLTEDALRSLLVVKISMMLGIVLGVCCLYLVRQCRRKEERGLLLFTRMCDEEHGWLERCGKG